MERDYNKNRRSFRSERSENRRGYEQSKEKDIRPDLWGTVILPEGLKGLLNGTTEKEENGILTGRKILTENVRLNSVTAGITVLVQRQPTGRTGPNVRNGRYW